MKVGILTFYFADNYGAVLQCLTLQEKCKELGCDAEIISYKPFQMVTWKSRVKQFVIKTPQQKAFQAFRDEHFIMSRKQSVFDCVIIGSDQVWNPNIIGFDDYWFSPKVNHKRICSYAASIGKSSLQGNELKFIEKQKQALKQYDVLSVREESGKSILDKIGIGSEIVCDPTLLYYYNPDFYKRLSAHSRLRKNEALKNGYILVYSLEKSKDIDDFAQKLKSETGYQVVSLHPMNGQTQQCDLFINDTDPYDFLYLIEQCAVMVTNSFHGLAFSYIFKKKVYCVSHSALSSRQSDFVKESGFRYEKINDNTMFIDCEQNCALLEKYIERSFSMLCKMLESR